MKRVVFAVIMALIFFVLLNFIYCNLDVQTLGYQMAFKFTIPGIFTVRTLPIPVGFALLLAFCIGMVMIAILEALPTIYKSLELRSKNKKIRQLERELTLMRQMSTNAGEKL
ncbi:MAG: LapA family protein [Deltaproteobacteria bacterium]|nr:LapA family protein [Deltaproteobacteria bacterium]